ncbi:MAG: hypothetical protein J6Z43_10575 [Clostridiales bacterium]|nr:hypothetical protein [Clostridiales bacterium]
MKTYFDEETDKKLLEAKSKEEVKAIISSLPEADRLADKTDIIMAEIDRIRNNVDEEITDDELENVAGGIVKNTYNLSESIGCVATFLLNDWVTGYIGCIGTDYCRAVDYLYHYTRWSNCPKGGKHNWDDSGFDLTVVSELTGARRTDRYDGSICTKCNLRIKDTDKEKYNFDS